MLRTLVTSAAFSILIILKNFTVSRESFSGSSKLDSFCYKQKFFKPTATFLSIDKDT